MAFGNAPAELAVIAKAHSVDLSIRREYEELLAAGRDLGNRILELNGRGYRLFRYGGRKSGSPVG